MCRTFGACKNIVSGRTRLKQSFLALNGGMPAYCVMLASSLAQTGRMRGSVGTTLVSIWQQEGVKGLFR